MKWVKELREWIAVGVGLLGLALMDDLATKLAAAYAWLSDAVGSPLAEALEVAAILVWSLCIVWAAIFLSRITLQLIVASVRKVPYIWHSMRGFFGMSEFISKGDAMKIIEASDFFQSRQPKAKRNLGGVSALWQWRDQFVGETERDGMLRRHFLRLVMQEFENQRPEAVTDDGYERSTLEKWLDDLFAVEVRNEMGAIPNV